MRALLTIILILVISNLQAKGVEYTGSTPAGPEVRRFLGISLSDSIDFIRWNLTIDDNTYALDCNYGLSKPNTAGFIKEGKRIKLTGPFNNNSNFYQFRNDNNYLNIAVININILHLLDENKKIDQRKLHLVARLGGDWYCKVDKSNLFQVEKPNVKLGIGVDVLPDNIRHSKILTGNNLAQLGNVHEFPVIDPAFHDERLKNIFQYYAVNPVEMETELHRHAKGLLDEGKVYEAWQVLLAND